jgi:hypothetical protein
MPSILSRPPEYPWPAEYFWPEILAIILWSIRVINTPEIVILSGGEYLGAG